MPLDQIFGSPKKERSFLKIQISSSISAYEGVCFVAVAVAPPPFQTFLFLFHFLLDLLWKVSHFVAYWKYFQRAVRVINTQFRFVLYYTLGW